MDENLFTLPQQRSIRASLLLFEKTLRMADRLLSEEDEAGILYYRTSRISTQRRELIRKKISQTLVDLAIISNQLGLVPSEDGVEKMIMGEIIICWENLEECRSKRLKGYGDLNPLAVELIDPAIDHLAKIAQEICGMVSKSLADDMQNDKSE